MNTEKTSFSIAIENLRKGIMSGIADTVSTALSGGNPVGEAGKAIEGAGDSIKHMKADKKDKKFEKVMHEFKAGTLKSSSGAIVKDRQQALAIAGSESGKYMEEDEEIEDDEEKKPMKKAFIKIYNGLFLRIDSDLEKAKKAAIGETATWADGKTYRKVSENKWELVEDKGVHKHSDGPGSGGDKKDASTPSKLHEIFRIHIEKMSDEHRAVFRGGKMDFDKRMFIAPGGKVALQYKGGNIHVIKMGDMAKAGPGFAHKYIKRVPKPTGKGYIYFYTRKQGEKGGGKQKEEEREEPREDILIDIEKMNSIRVPKEIKEHGIDSQEYKQWVKENWAKTPKPKLSLVEKESDKKSVTSDENQPDKSAVTSQTKGFDSGAPEKFSKDYESYAESVKSDIKKNNDIADYYLEHLQKDIKQSGQRIKSIKKEAKPGDDYTSAISGFEERIKDASILSKQIKEILGNSGKNQSDKREIMSGEKEKSEELSNILIEKYRKESIGGLKEALKYDSRKEHVKAIKSVIKEKENEFKTKQATPSRDLAKNDYPDKITTEINNPKYSSLSNPPEGYTNETTIKKTIDKKEIKGGFEIFGKKFFIAKGPYGMSWAAYEEKTGKRVGSGKTIKNTIEDGKKIIKQAGEEKLKQALGEPLQKASQLATGTKVESEHKETVDFITKYVKDHGEMPKGIDVYRHIAQDHINGSGGESGIKDYYTRLIAMEKQAKVKRPKIELDVIDFLSKNPNPPDDKVHAFAEKMKINPHDLEKVFYKLATESAKMESALKKASSDLFSELEKAKKMPVGTVSKGRKKVAEGKWVPETEDKEKPKKKEPGKTPEKKDDKKGKVSGISEEQRGVIKSALKKMANILAEAFSGKGGVQAAGEAVEQGGENIQERAKRASKPKDKGEK